MDVVARWVEGLSGERRVAFASGRNIGRGTPVQELR